MPGSVQVVKNLGNGFVQVDAKSKRTIPQSYKVVEASADAFCREYQANDTKMKKKANIIDFGLMPISTIPSYILLNKLGLGQTAKFIIATVIAMGIMYGGNAINGNKYLKQRQNIIQKYKAEEIEEPKKEDVFEKALK